MVFAQRRATVILAALAVMASTMFWAGPAEAATCRSIPGSTPGTDVTIAGNTFRVPAISNIQVCTDGATVPGARVDQGGGTCTSNCLSVFVLGGEADGGGVTVSWREDGSTRSTGLDPGGAGGGSEICVLSVGTPDAPYPNCLVAIGPDGDPVQDVEDLVLGLADPVCSTIPPQQDPWGNNVEFCDDPGGWIQIVCNNNPGLCEGDVQTIRDIFWAVVCFVEPSLPQCPDF